MIPELSLAGFIVGHPFDGQCRNPDVCSIFTSKVIYNFLFFFGLSLSSILTRVAWIILTEDRNWKRGKANKMNCTG
ncbi:hypothetical protein SDJN02_22076 [Cucurbita argyrosperma subsp. argyrosperma]|nr:hypothetical protein SDJN02_22076 [Cucurbita argyrosperma subsp. argyrosperma]